MDWSENVVDKGVVKKGDSVEHTFIYNGELAIKRIEPLCKCIKIIKKHPKYTIKFKIKSNTAKTIMKTVEVRYEDGSRSYLIIKAKNEIQ